MLQIETSGLLGPTKNKKRPHANRGGIRMRQTGDMRLKLGHEQAGLRDVLVPVRARLEDPREMPTHVVDARGIIDKAVLKVVLIAHAVLLPLE